MIVIHHNKDMDGYTSGAICKLKYPDAKLIGWDYVDPIPDFEQFRGEDVIMIDITFPVAKIDELRKITKHITIIDHHVSFKNDFVKFYDLPSGERTTQMTNICHDLRYEYELGKAACEIGWEFFFPHKSTPKAITLIGRYDTWRKEEGDWDKETLPFKFYMYGNCNSAETFPMWLLDEEQGDNWLGYECIGTGMEIMRYQETMDESIVAKNAFERQMYGLRAICINYYPFSSEVMKSVYDPSRHDVMVGFAFTGKKWVVSLRSVGDINVSEIAKARGGGGHKNAAGYEVNSFDKIWEQE